MEYNYIGIDTSLSSTGIYIRLKDNTEHYFNYKNNSKLSKWHKILDFITYRSYDNIKSNTYTETEILKLLQYDKITTQMVTDILSICKPEETIIITEGYSYSSSNTSSLIDLIGFATLLRIKLLKLNLVDFIIKSPSTLKLDTCKYTYQPIEKKIGGKNPRTEYIYKSDERISGGRFTKREMLKSLNDNTNIDIKFKNILDFHVQDVLRMVNIPKPIDDMVDAIFLAWTSMIENNEIDNIHLIEI
jgi:hypothetical protein